MSVVVVLSDCPSKLRGDMTKWLFEINTGVYVGNINARVRENLWKRITENIGRGHATMVYNAPGEQHLDFRVHNAYWEPVDYDGLKLMRRPNHASISSASTERNNGFSKASQRQHPVTRRNSEQQYSAFLANSYVVLNLGIADTNSNSDMKEISEIAAILVDRGKTAEKMHCLVKRGCSVSTCCAPNTIIEQTQRESFAIPLEIAIQNLIRFMEDLPVVCFNASLERDWFLQECRRLNEIPDNRFIDVSEMAKQLMEKSDIDTLSELATWFGIPCASIQSVSENCDILHGIYVKLKELASSKSRKNE